MHAALISNEKAFLIFNLFCRRTAELGNFLSGVHVARKIAPISFLFIFDLAIASKDAFSFDINAACTGFVYALDIAKKYIESGQIKYALVVGTEKITSLLDWADRNTCVLFGDGAGAMIVAASNEPGIISSTIGSDGSFKDLLTVNTDLEYIEMKGSDVFKTAVNTLGKLAKHTLEINCIEQGELDWLVPHQANERIILAIAKKINLPKDKIIITVNKHGNTSAASIPLAFDTANSKNTFKSGDLIMLEAFGAGFTWGSVLLKY